MKTEQIKKSKTLKTIIVFCIIAVILLLLAFSEDIMKMLNKDNIAMLATDFDSMPNEPNIPMISAGMIPVKWDGTNWVITTKNDSDWYDYNNRKPAYIMLNDGVYQSELIQDMEGKQLAEDNINMQIQKEQLGTIFLWIPRYAYKETGEIKYAQAEIMPGGEWIIPDMFICAQSKETVPNFSLSGIWLQKDVDDAYSSKITEMNKEEGKYGFLANTKPIKINSTDTTVLQKYVGNNAPAVPLDDITNLNRIILKIVDTRKIEPIKANITYSEVDKKIEIRVTYTTNGISKILDEHGNSMSLAKMDGIIYTDTGEQGLIRGTYTFTVIDNKDNKKELTVYANPDSLYKVAYISGIDNMDNTATYNKIQETQTSDENALLNQIKATDTSKTFSRAIEDRNKAITAIGEKTRTDEDEQLYLYEKYKANIKNSYSVSQSSTYRSYSGQFGKGECDGYSSYSLDQSTGKVTLSSPISSPPTQTRYGISSSLGRTTASTVTTSGSFYKFVYASLDVTKYTYKVYTMTIKKTTTYSRGAFVSNVVALDDTYTIGSSSKVHSDGYWYVRNSIAPKYTLYKYDQDLNLQSTYDVDSKIITTVPINISNKGNNKVKLKLTTSGSDYKTYISNDNLTWQEITGISSGTPKELDVKGWDNLYIKIETNTSRIDDIDVAYYKD